LATLQPAGRRRSNNSLLIRCQQQQVFTIFSSFKMGYLHEIVLLGVIPFKFLQTTSAYLQTLDCLDYRLVKTHHRRSVSVCNYATT